VAEEPRRRAGALGRLPRCAGGETEYLGLSGFVLFALHRIGTPGLQALDRDWMERLPDETPALHADEASGKAVQVGTRYYPDDTLYRALPWTIVAT